MRKDFADGSISGRKESRGSLSSKKKKLKLEAEESERLLKGGKPRGLEERRKVRITSVPPAHSSSKFNYSKSFFIIFDSRAPFYSEIRLPTD